MKIHCTNYLQLFCVKNRSKKHEIFKKWEHFENRTSCRGSSPCKILTLAQIKIQKNISKTILQFIYSCSLQKTARKNNKYSRNVSILKIGHYAKAIAHEKPSLWLKYKHQKKKAKIHSTNHLELFRAKNRSKKQKIFEK